MAVSSSSELSQSSSESDSDDATPEKNDSSSFDKDEKAVCERCEAVGLRRDFYSKAKKFCSISCSKAGLRAGGNKPSWSMKSSKCSFTEDFKKTATSPKKSKLDLKGSFEWKEYLQRPDFIVAPVSCFRHVALADCWNSIVIGTKMEIENKDCGSVPCSFWIASIVKISGYMASLRYEGFGLDNSQDIWINLCTEKIYPVGYCASQGKPLIPPKSIENKHTDWKQYLMKRLLGSRTIPANFHVKVQEGMNNRIQHGMKLEVVDKNRISAVRVAAVNEVVGGRLHVAYEASEDGDEGFWCHEQSPLIHPVGWAQVIGHDLKATPEYAKKSLQKTLLRKFEPDDATWDMFFPVRNPMSDLKFKEGMKLEAIDPLNLSTVCVATVTRVLRNNYLMIGIDGMMAANGSDWFCYHASSPCIFPVGFCEKNKITLTPPRGYRGEFIWPEYLKQTKATAAPVGLFKKEVPNHGFKEGMYVEAVDLMEPRLICVASITKVVGRLLRVHFDGWEIAYDQWCDCESPDLFPVGWCQVVGYRLEPPRSEISPDSLKKKKKNQGYKGLRRKKKKYHIQVKKYYQISPAAENVTKSPLSENAASPILPTIRTSLPYTNVSNSNSSTKLDIDDDKRHDIMNTTNIPETELSMSTFHNETNPKNWSFLDVTRFLRMNECANYCHILHQQKVDGQKFISLNKDDLMRLMGMKVGPALKISRLIQQLQLHMKRCS